MKAWIFTALLLFSGVSGCVSAGVQSTSAPPPNSVVIEPVTPIEDKCQELDTFIWESVFSGEDIPDELGYFVREDTTPHSLYFNRRGDEKGERFAEAIYRDIKPDFDATKQDLAVYLSFLKKTFEFESLYAASNRICAMLYSPKLIYLPDEELEAIFLSQDVLCDVSSDEMGGFHVRAISIYFLQGTMGEYIWEGLMDNIHFTFVQSRRDGDVWVQPVLEGYVYDHFMETTLLETNGLFYLLLEGISEYPRKYFADIGFCYVFKAGKWRPANISDAYSAEALSSLAERGGAVLLEGYWISLPYDEAVYLHPKIERRELPIGAQRQMMEQ